MQVSLCSYFRRYERSDINNIIPKALVEQMKRVSQEENYEFDYKGITDRFILEYSKYQKRPFTRSETIHNLNQGSASKREKEFEKHPQPKMKRGISVQNLTEKLSPRKEVRTGYAQKRNQNTQKS
jgi:hypothetical protein